MIKSFNDFIDKNYFWTIFLLLTFGIIIRFLGLSIIPSGLNQDEASIGYEAYSLLTTGADRNGITYPIHFISWGSGQNALYAYLSIPFIQLFGLNAFSVRFLNALMSSISLIAFFLLFKNVFSKRKAFLALAFLCICPWSIMSARWGLESNIFPALFLSGVLFLFLGFEKKQFYYIFSSVFFALSLYSYGTSYLIIPVFFIITAPYLIHSNKISIKYGLIFIFIFLIISLPIILFVIINHFDLPELKFMGLTIPRLIENRTTTIFNLFSLNFPIIIAKNIIRFLGILFLQIDNNLYNAIPSFGIIYHISLPFFFFGFYSVIKSKHEFMKPLNFIMCAWFASAAILGISSNININRINIIVFPIIYFVILGIYNIKEIINTGYHTLYKRFLILFFTISFLFFIGYYLTFFNKENKKDFAFGFRECIEYVNEKYPSDTIDITTHTINMPYIYAAFYSKTNPIIFRNTVVYDNESFNSGFIKVLSFDKFNFVFPGEGKNKIAIISEDEFTLSDNAWWKSDIKFGNYHVVANK